MCFQEGRWKALFGKKGQRRQGAFAGAARLLQGQQGEGQGRQPACCLSWQSSVRRVRFEPRRECRINHAIQNGGVRYISNDKEKIREFSDLRRLQLPTRLEISNFRSDVDTSTSTDSISQTSGNVNPSDKNISRTSVQRASTTTFQCRLLSCCRPLNSLKAPAITEALLRYFFNTQDNASFILHIQYMRHGNFCQYLFAKNRPRFITTIFLLLLLELSVRRFA